MIRMHYNLIHNVKVYAAFTYAYYRNSPFFLSWDEYLSNDICVKRLYVCYDLIRNVKVYANVI